MRWLVSLFVLLSLALPAAAQVPLPQSVSPPLVPSGLNSAGQFTSRQLGQFDIQSPLPVSTSPSTTFIGQQQMQFVLDAPAGFLAGQVVQVTASDPTQWVICAIVSLDTNGNMTCNYMGAINGGGGYFTGFTIQVIGGSPLQGVPIWAGLGVDGTDSVTNPSAQGNVVTLNIETGKAFTNFSTVYVWAPQDITTWFVGVVLSYNTSSGQMKVFVTQTPNTGNSYSTNYVSLIDTQGPAPALSGYSSTSQTLGSGSFTFTTQSGQFFPIDGQVLASCIDQANPNAYMAGQVTAYSGTSLIINVSGSNGVFGSGTCGAWSLYLTTGPTTRISLYQMNGLQFINNSGGSDFIINAGSVRDSTDTVDLVYSGGTLSYASGSSQFARAAGPGTISGTTSVTGTSTTFTSTFSAVATLTDLSNQLSALNLSAVSFPSVITNTNSPGNATAATTTVTDSTHLTTNGSLSASSGSSYTRGGILNTTAAVAYGIILAYHTSDGTVAPFAVSFTPSGTPDIPAGYSYYRVIGYVVIGAANAVQAIAQPLVANVLTTPGDIPYFGSTTAFSGTYQSYLQRLPIGSSGNVLEVSSGLPAWVSFATACTAATSSTFGCVKPDGTIITNSSGAITVAKGSSSAFGVVEVDNSTITAASGVITAANTTVAGATCTPGSSCGLSKVQNTLSGDVALNNTGNYFDGPSMAQGTSGTWFASGTVTVGDTAGGTANATINCKLWDGTTVIASTSNLATANLTATTHAITETLSGYLASPAGNIRISCKDITATTGKILFNFTGTSADSSIWGIRINFLEHPIPANDNDLIEKLAA